MGVKFSFHALYQLKERQISKKLVEKILTKPDQIIDSTDNRKIAQKIVKEGSYKFLYRIIYSVKENNFLVISAYKTTKINKYLVKE